MQKTILTLDAGVGRFNYSDEETIIRLHSYFSIMLQKIYQKIKFTKMVFSKISHANNNPISFLKSSIKQTSLINIFSDCN